MRKKNVEFGRSDIFDRNSRQSKQRNPRFLDYNDARSTDRRIAWKDRESTDHRSRWSETNMNETQWKKGISKAGKIPTKPFSAILTAIYPGEIANGTKALMLDFDNEYNVAIFGIAKAKITDDGVEVGGSLAQFQESLEQLGFECYWGTDSNEIMGFKAEKDGIDLVGHKLSMQPLEEQTVGDDTQTKKSVFWGIVTKIEKVAQALAKKQPEKFVTKSGKEPQRGDISGILIDALDTPKTISELFITLGKKYKVSELRDALGAMEKDGVVSENNGKWQVI